MYSRKIDSVEQDLPGGHFVQPGHQLDDRRFSLAVRSDQRDSLARFQPEIDVVQHRLVLPGIAERNIPEFESLANWPRARQAVRLGVNLRLHAKEFDQVREEQGVIGNMRKGREHRLNVGAGSGDGSGQERQVPSVNTPVTVR